MALAKDMAEPVRILETAYTEAELLDMWHASRINQGIEVRTKGKELEDLGWTPADLQKVGGIRDGR